MTTIKFTDINGNLKEVDIPKGNLTATFTADTTTTPVNYFVQLSDGSPQLPLQLATPIPELLPSALPTTYVLLPIKDFNIGGTNYPAYNFIITSEGNLNSRVLLMIVINGAADLIGNNLENNVVQGGFNTQINLFDDENFTHNIGNAQIKVLYQSWNEWWYWDSVEPYNFLSLPNVFYINQSDITFLKNAAGNAGNIIDLIGSYVSTPQGTYKINYISGGYQFTKAISKITFQESFSFDTGHGQIDLTYLYLETNKIGTLQIFGTLTDYDGSDLNGVALLDSSTPQTTEIMSNFVGTAGKKELSFSDDLANLAVIRITGSISSLTLDANALSQNENWDVDIRETYTLDIQ